MKIIGVTGGVGCGKSTLLKAIKDEYNCVVLYADDAAKDVERKGQKCYEELLDLLGEGILDEQSQIDPYKMSGMIFGNDELLDKVNGIVHPAVKEFILSSIEDAKNKGYEYFFLEAALLIECGYNSIVDEMWYVYADEEVRRKRLMDSRGYTDTKIDSIMKSQLSEKEFKDNSDFVIDNSFSIENSIMQIKRRIGK